MNSARKAARLCGQLLRIALTHPARLRHVLGTALWASDEVAARTCDLLRFRLVDAEALLPAAGPPLSAELALFPRTQASISVLEATCLVLLLKQANARAVFEFGTYKGVSITQLALNVPPDGRIYTLDLPESLANTRYSIVRPDDAAIAGEPGKGALVPAALRPRVHFLQQDSAAFDATPYAGQMDFVFVDGAHNYDYVRNDSEKGWQMLRPGGIIAWHDCSPRNPDVVRYLLENSFQPTRIFGTTLAFAVKPGDSDRS